MKHFSNRTPFSVFLFITVITQVSLVTSQSNGLQIVGGHNISIEEAPYQISLEYQNQHSCGGSIISPTWIVTAAHCTNGVHSSEFSVRAGTTIREHGGQLVSVNQIFNHPNYDEQTIDYDVAVIELKTPLTFGNSVAAIDLPSENQTWPDGTEVFVSGWGVTDDDELATVLQGVTVNIVNKESCSAAYSGIGEITDHMLCAGVTEGGKDACQSDSGGPLTVNGVLGGIVSWGSGCGLPGIPGVYTSVPSIRDFIKQITGQ